MNVIALLPAYSHVDWRLQDTLRRVHMPYIHANGLADLVRVRSRLLCDAMRTGADVFVFIDSDMAVTPEQLTRLIESPKLDEHNAVSGCYVTSQGQLAAVPLDFPERTVVQVAGTPQYLELIAAGMGFAAVHRATVERLEQASRLVRDFTGETWYPHFFPILLDYELPDGMQAREYLAEDYSFWWRVRTVTNTSLWLDTHLPVGHVKQTVLMPAGDVPVGPRAT